MAYATFRVRSIKKGSIGTTEDHNKNRKNHLGETPENIHPERSHLNKQLFFYGQEDQSLEQIIEDREKELNVKGIKENSVHAIEVVVSITDKNVWKKYDIEGYFRQYQDFFLEKTFGQGNVISCSIHMDESNPHAHFIINPIKQKEVKWKNRRGEGTKIENHLCAQDFIGGRDKLRNLQQLNFEFAQSVFKSYGIDIYRGTLAEHNKREYTQQTNHEIGELRAKLADLKNETERKQIIEQIDQKNAEFGLKMAEFDKKIEQRSKTYQKDPDKWKKLNFMPEWGEKKPKPKKGPKL